MLSFRNNREALLSATIWLVRHAEHGDIGRRLTGRGPEDGLTAAGKIQAQETAARLAEEPVAAIYASPRLRTRQTAEIIAEPHRLPVAVDEALDEIDFGDWTGCEFGELDGQPAWDRWNAARSLARCPNGESMTEATDRAARFISQAAARHSGERIVVVTHCDIIRGLLCRQHGRSLDAILSFEAGPASVTRLEAGAAWKAAA